MATHILLKLNQFPSSIQSSTPNDWFNMILTKLNEFLLIIPNFFHSMFTKLQEIFSAENLEAAKPYLLAGLGVVFLCLFCWCCLLPIISCIAWIVATIWGLVVGFFLLLWGLIRGFFMIVWNMCRSVFCCCRGSARMMKAPGRGGKMFMQRASFEANPRAYFINLRAGKPLLR